MRRTAPPPIARALSLSSAGCVDQAILAAWAAAEEPACAYRAYRLVASLEEQRGDTDAAKHALYEALDTPGIRRLQSARLWEQLAKLHAPSDDEAATMCQRNARNARRGQRRIEWNQRVHARSTATFRKTAIWSRRVVRANVFHALSGPDPNPIVSGDLAFVAISSPASVVAVERQTGRIRWRFDAGPYGSASVQVGRELLFWQTTHTLFALDPATGTQRWAFSPHGPDGEDIYSSPVLHDESVFVGDRDGVLHCLSASDGRLLWRKQTTTAKNRDVNATGLVSQRRYIVATNAGVALAYHLPSGRLAWKTKLDGPCGGHLQSYHGDVALSTGASIYVLRPKDGRVLARRRWKGRVVWRMTVCGDQILAITLPRDAFSDKQFSTKRSFWNRAYRLAAISLNAQLYERPMPAFPGGIRYSEETGLAYESLAQGIGILDPKTGRRVCYLRAPHGRNATPVDVYGAVIYALRGAPTSIWALKHPPVGASVGAA